MDMAKLKALMGDKKAALKPKAKTLKPNPGANRYVLLPGWRKGEEHVWFHEFGQHFIKNAADELQAVYLCTDKTFGKPCAVCSTIGAAAKTADDDTIELLKKAASNGSFLFNVLALDDKDDAIPQILEVRKSVFGQIVELTEEWGDALFDSTAPQIFTITREGKGLLTKYTVQISPKKHTLPANVLSKLNNIDEYVRQESEELQRKAIAAINNVAGLLPAPSASADRPRTPALAASDSSDDDLRAVETRNVKEAKKPAASDIALESELDDLLGELATGTGE